MELNLDDKEIGREIKQEREQEDIKTRLSRAMDIFKPQFLEMARTFTKVQPLYYDKSGIWWAWSDARCSWEMIDDVDILNLVQRQNAKNDDFPVLRKDHIINSIKMVAREAMPDDMPVNLVQFKHEIVDLNTGNTFQASPKYFCTNPIPWNLGKSDETPVMDKLITEWVGEKYLQTVYEVIAYCCYRSYPIHLCFAFVGSGCNGKSTLQALVHRFVGYQNICSLDFDRLTNPNSRFETSKAYKKLIASISETNFGSLDNSTQFKKITGQDPMDYEFKNKNPFTDFNYAKVLINSNGLPTSEDQSEGFYRRWLIIDFPNNFPEGKDILNSIPEKEYENLARKCIKLLRDLLQRGTFTNQGTIEERKKKYLESSNPISIFLSETCVPEHTGKVKYNELYNHYVRWLIERKKRIVKRKEFKESLIQEGYDVDKTWHNNENGWFVTGLNLKSTLQHFTSSQQSETLDDGLNHQLPVVEEKVDGWMEWIDAQPGGTVELDQFLANFPLLDYKKMITSGELYEPRPGFVRRLL